MPIHPGTANGECGELARVSTLTTNGYRGIRHSKAVLRLRLFSNTVVAASLLAVLVLGPAANAVPHVYLPPQNLTWERTGPETVQLAWEAPLDADASTTYNVYADNLLVGHTANTTFLGNFAGIAVVHVTAVHPSESSSRTRFQTTLPQIVSTESAPAWTVVGVVCWPVAIVIGTSAPYADVFTNPECIPG